MAYVIIKLNGETVAEVEVEDLSDAMDKAQEIVLAKYPGADFEETDVTGIMLDLALPVPVEQMGT